MTEGAPLVVGTWNIEGDARQGSVELLLGLRAHVLLLTEVPPGFILPGYRTTELRQPTMRPTKRDGQHYAAVSVLDELELEQIEPPSITSAAARVGGTAFVSTVLPWPNAPAPPYLGATQAEQTENALDELEPWLDEHPALVWGGDWNHPLDGSLSGFTERGHKRIAAAVDRLGLTVHTRNEWAQQNRYGKHRSVDHIASRHDPVSVRVVVGRPYSSHDAYAVQLLYIQRSPRRRWRATA